VETLIRTGLDGQMSATVEKQFPINQCVYHAALALCLAAAATAGCRSAESQMPQKATIMKSDDEQLLQMTLDLEKLDGYFHVGERPERPQRAHGEGFRRWARVGNRERREGVSDRCRDAA